MNMQSKVLLGYVFPECHTFSESLSSSSLKFGNSCDNGLKTFKIDFYEKRLGKLDFNDY